MGHFPSGRAVLLSSQDFHSESPGQGWKGGVRVPFVEGVVYLSPCLLLRTQAECLREGGGWGFLGAGPGLGVCPVPEALPPTAADTASSGHRAPFFSLVTSRGWEWHRTKECHASPARLSSVEDGHRGKGQGVGGGEEHPWKGTPSI